MTLVGKSIIISHIGQLVEMLTLYLRKGKLELANTPVLPGSNTHIFLEYALKSPVIKA